MAWLHFSRTVWQLTLYAGSDVNSRDSKLLGVWKAHNETARNSKGYWPNGTYKWSHYNAHIDQPGYGPGCFATAYGCFGIHVFRVPGRSGMGVHAGRQMNDWRQPGVPLGTKTLGCIRTSEDAMSMINSVHNAERLQAIVVTY